MALTVKLEGFELPKAKAHLVAKVEFRGKYIEEGSAFIVLLLALRISSIILFWVGRDRIEIIIG